MNNSYHNTNNLESDELAKRDCLAITQEEKILALFTRTKDDFTPSEVHKLIFNNSTPITSVRRAMTNLTRDNHLVKTDTQRLGDFGNLCYAWRLA